MTSIAGIIGAAPRSLIRRMTACMARGGPESERYYERDWVRIGVRESNAHAIPRNAQPILNESGDKCIVCNGHVYNRQTLRAQLAGRGHVFRTNSDEEVILHSYEEVRDGCVSGLRGMFAFAIADGHTVLLGRDHLGIKPLYYVFQPEKNRFLFASEIKPLLQDHEFIPRLNEPKLTELVFPGYPIGDETFIQGVYALRPGHTLTVDIRDGRVSFREKEYFRLTSGPAVGVNAHEARRDIARLLLASLDRHLGSDAETAIALSGGLDSSVITYLVRQREPRALRTFTLGADAEHPDILAARQVVQHVDAQHHEIVVTYGEYVDAIPKWLIARAGPNGMAGIGLYLLAREMSPHARVGLLGEGADALFGGFAELVEPERAIAMMRARGEQLVRSELPLTTAVKALMEALTTAHDRAGCIAMLFDWKMRHTHCKMIDACSIASGVEMRMPFVDTDLVEYVFKLPPSLKMDGEAGVSKPLLRAVALDLAGRKALSPVHRPKLPLPDSCARHASRFAQFCDRSLPQSYVSSHPYRRYVPTAEGVLLLDLFRAVFIDGRGVCPTDVAAPNFMAERAWLNLFSASRPD